MNDVITVAVFAAKVLCLIVFVSVLKPDGTIGAIQRSAKPADCRTNRAEAQKCSLSVLAAASLDVATPCAARPSVAHC